MSANWWTAIDNSELAKELFPSWNGLSVFGLSVGPAEAVAKISTVIDSAKCQAVHPDAKIDPGAKIVNSIVGAGVEVYEGATIRDSVVLKGTTVGHCSEVARSVIMENCFIPRFNYVGGSLLGSGTNLGGAATFASKRHDNTSVAIAWGENRVDTGRWKFGSIVGEGCTVSFSAHVNPGSVIGSNCLIMPYVDIRGYTPSDSIVFMRQSIIEAKRRDMPDLGMLRKSM